MVISSYMRHPVYIEGNQTISYFSYNIAVGRPRPGRTKKPWFDSQQRQVIALSTKASRRLRSGAHRAHYSVDTGGSLPLSKAVGT